MLTVSELKIGDRVQDSRGTVGEVVESDHDHVFILWSGGVLAVSHTDAQLVDLGITRWSPVRRVER